MKRPDWSVMLDSDGRVTALRHRGDFVGRVQSATLVSDTNFPLAVLKLEIVGPFEVLTPSADPRPDLNSDFIPRCKSTRATDDKLTHVERCLGALGHRGACFGGVPPPPEGPKQ